MPGYHIYKTRFGNCCTDLQWVLSPTLYFPIQASIGQSADLKKYFDFIIYSIVLNTINVFEVNHYITHDYELHCTSLAEEMFVRHIVSS